MPYSPAARRSVKIWSPTIAIRDLATPKRRRATRSPGENGLHASGTYASPTRCANGRTRLSVLLDTMVRLTPAARMVSSHWRTESSSTWLPSAVRVLSTSRTSAVMPCCARNSGVMDSMRRKTYSGVKIIEIPQGGMES